MGALEWCLATGRKPAEEETLIGKELNAQARLE